jgi:hypothetical protein
MKDCTLSASLAQRGVIVFVTLVTINAILFLVIRASTGFSNGKFQSLETRPTVAGGMRPFDETV